jgi:hypothetical protein
MANVEASDPIRTATKPQALVGSDDGKASGDEPVIIDLGKKNRKQVRRLRKGKPGRLMRRIEETIEQLRTSGEFGGDIRPVIIVVRQKSRRSRKGRRAAKMWGLG